MYTARKENNPIHSKADNESIELFREKFPDHQFVRIHGLPRDNVNEGMHSMAAKKFNEATKPPTESVFKAIIAATVAHKMMAVE